MFQINISSLRSYLFLNPEVVRSCNQTNENFQLAMPTGAGFKVTATFHQHIVAGFIGHCTKLKMKKLKFTKSQKTKADITVLAYARNWIILRRGPEVKAKICLRLTQMPSVQSSQPFL